MTNVVNERCDFTKKFANKYKKTPALSVNLLEKTKSERKATKLTETV